MESKFHIKGNEYTPTIKVGLNGGLTVEGESRHENPKKYYEDLYNQITEEIGGDIITSIELKFEYISSSSILPIISFVKKIENFSKPRDIDVYWLYDVMDEDIMELGEIIKESHGIQLELRAQE